MTNHSSAAPLSAGRAVAYGLLVVNGPVLGFILGGIWIGAHLSGGAPARTMALFGVGFVLAWLWWSLSVPRWRIWALARGADPDKLQELGQRAGVVWPRGSFFEKTELPPRSRSE
jgi:hypothetical protein